MKIRGGRVPTGLLRRQLDVVEERIRSATSLEALMTMEWPGNVRELRMVLTPAAVRAPRRRSTCGTSLPSTGVRALAATSARLDLSHRQGLPAVAQF